MIVYGDEILGVELEGGGELSHDLPGGVYELTEHWRALLAVSCK